MSDVYCHKNGYVNFKFEAKVVREALHEDQRVREFWFWEERSTKLFILILRVFGPGSSVGIVTDYGLDGSGIESRWWGEIFRTCPDRPWGPTSLLYDGYRVFPGGKERPERDADPSHTSSAVVYSPYGPYGLYRVRVPVQGCTLHFTLLRYVKG